MSSGRATIEELQEIQDILYAWGLSKAGSELIAQQVVNCLEEAFLLSLPPPVRNHWWPQQPGMANRRYLFHRQVAALLGWTQNIPEGDPAGVPPKVEQSLREKQWPKAHDETSSKGDGSREGAAEEREAPASSNTGARGRPRRTPRRAAPIGRSARRAQRSPYGTARELDSGGSSHGGNYAPGTASSPN